jgi:hypothetical protein
MRDDRSPVFAELDRVGASFARAGARDYVSVQLGLDEVKLLGPPRDHPRRSWLGPECHLLELLAPLPDDAGVRFRRPVARSRYVPPTVLHGEGMLDRPGPKRRNRHQVYLAVSPPGKARRH